MYNPIYNHLYLINGHNYKIPQVLLQSSIFGPFPAAVPIGVRTPGLGAPANSKFCDM